MRFVELLDLKAFKDPKADELRNKKNINQGKEERESKPEINTNKK